MNSNAKYKNEFDTAKAILTDARVRGADAIGGDALELMTGLLTPEEKVASDLRVGLMLELTRARNERGL